MYSVTTSGKKKKCSSLKLNQTHTRQDPKENMRKNAGSVAPLQTPHTRGTNTAGRGGAPRRSQRSLPEFEGKALGSEARHGTYPGVPERHRQARREHRSSRHPRVAVGRQRRRQPHPRSAQPHTGQPGHGRGCFPSAPPAWDAGNCGQRPERWRCRPGGPASQRRFQGGSHGSLRGASPGWQPGQGLRRPPFLPLSLLPSLPGGPRTRPAPPLVPRMHTRRQRPLPAYLERGPAGAGAGRGGTDGGWLDGWMDGWRDGSGSRGSRARAGANCAKRRPLVQRVHARARSRWRRGRAWPGAPRDPGAAPGRRGKEARVRVAVARERRARPRQHVPQPGASRREPARPLGSGHQPRSPRRSSCLWLRSEPGLGISTSRQRGGKDAPPSRCLPLHPSVSASCF